MFSGDGLLTRKRLYRDYDKWNISMVICDADIPEQFSR